MQNRVLWRIDLLVSNGIGHFEGCGIEAHQNGVLFRMLTYCAATVISLWSRESSSKKPPPWLFVRYLDDLQVANTASLAQCGIEAHQNGVLFRMLTYCVVQRRADLLLQPLKNLRCSL